MSFFIRFMLVIIFFNVQGFCESISTFYGPIEIEEPVLLELIHSPAFHRLKSIHQYGVAFYTTHREEYNRYDHSLGVLTILKMKGASLEEQVAGLLHDISHTVFSHVGDWVFKIEFQENDYQSTIQNLYLVSSGLEEVLNKHGFTLEQISSKRKTFQMLEQPLPNLCADRIDYNIQGAYYQNFLTRDEALEFFNDLIFDDGKWISTKIDIAKKLTKFSLFMTEDCWGSALNYMLSKWLADAILQALNTGLISWNEFHFGVDQRVWDELLHSYDPLIRNRMNMIHHPNDYFQIVSPADATLFVKFKCRGIDPWIKLESNLVRLTSLDPNLAELFQKSMKQAKMGWPVKIQSFQEP